MNSNRQFASNQYMNLRQSGAALLTTMVFLVVLTAIGVSTMQNNRQEQKVSTNIQELNHSFNYAESGIVAGLQSLKSLQSDNLYTNVSSSVDYSAPDIWLCADPDDPSIRQDCEVGSNTGNAAVITRYRGRANIPPANYSLSSGFTTHFFSVSSRGTSQQAVSTHHVGTSIVGPSGPGD
jgi:Tfp pilus assembly protein PilX